MAKTGQDDRNSKKLDKSRISDPKASDLSTKVLPVTMMEAISKLIKVLTNNPDISRFYFQCPYVLIVKYVIKWLVSQLIQ